MCDVFFHDSQKVLVTAHHTSSICTIEQHMLINQSLLYIACMLLVAIVYYRKPAASSLRMPVSPQTTPVARWRLRCWNQASVTAWWSGGTLIWAESPSPWTRGTTDSGGTTGYRRSTSGHAHYDLTKVIYHLTIIVKFSLGTKRVKDFL